MQISNREQIAENVLSWIALAIASASFAFLAYRAPIITEATYNLLKGFDTTLPQLTILMLQIPSYTWGVVAAIAILAMFCVQIFIRSKRIAMMIHVLLFMFAFGTLNVYQHTMLDPLVNISDGLNRPKKLPGKKKPVSFNETGLQI